MKKIGPFPDKRAASKAIPKWMPHIMVGDVIESGESWFIMGEIYPT